MWDNIHDCCDSFIDFSEELHKVFDHSALGTEAACALSLLQEGGWSVSEPVSLVNVLEAYHDLRADFSLKSQASSLSPQCPYDCAIDLLPGTPPPRGCLYSLSGSEWEAMEKYIHDSQVAGII